MIFKFMISLFIEFNILKLNLVKLLKNRPLIRSIIATWNINLIPLRNLWRLVAEHNPEVISLMRRSIKSSNINQVY